MKTKTALLLLFSFGIQNVFGQSNTYNSGFEESTKNKIIQIGKKKMKVMAVDVLEYS